MLEAARRALLRGGAPSRSRRAVANARHRIVRCHARKANRGLTLVEMLIATAITLLMMSAVLNLFANLGASVRNRRALIEVDGRLRQVRAQLARDLACATCPATTWHNPGANEGYIEILEGRYSNWNPSELVDLQAGNGELDYSTSQVPSSQFLHVPVPGNPHPDDMNPEMVSYLDSQSINPSSVVTDGRALGDYDDVLALTVRNQDEPFVARLPGGRLVESSLAEVVWFAEEDDDGFRQIFRRVLLIAPWVPVARNQEVREVISTHWDGNNWQANTLGDLTKRENRFQHRVDYSDSILEYPHEMRVGRLDRGDEAEFLMLSDAVAFDIRVFDPDAPVYANLATSTAIEPCDAGWGLTNSQLITSAPVSFGAYVDLGWNFDPRPSRGNRRTLTGVAAEAAFRLPYVAGSKQSIPIQGYPAVYDTWSLHYESDGYNQDARQAISNNEPWRSGIDQGTNGIDDNFTGPASNRVYLNGVDDMGERETGPPYDVPLRGVRVIMRVYETDARQVRATSVVHSFVD